MVVHEAISLLSDLIDQADLEQLIDNLEYEVFREEVVVVLAYSPVDGVERESILLLFEHWSYEYPELFRLVLDRVDVVLRCWLQRIEKTFFF